MYPFHLPIGLVGGVAVGKLGFITGGIGHAGGMEYQHATQFPVLERQALRGGQCGSCGGVRRLAAKFITGACQHRDIAIGGQFQIIGQSF